MSDTWYSLQEQKIAMATGVAIDDALRERVERDFPPPRHLDFRMAGIPQKKPKK